ncbi:MAG TPA: hypothetical protein VIZ62_10405 [Nitrososphaeraceae archaeon]
MTKNDVCEENSPLIQLFDNNNAQSYENFMDKDDNNNTKLQK